MESLIAILDALPFGIIVLDPHGRVAQSNKIAKILLRDRMGIYERKNFLHAAWAPDHCRLRELIEHICHRFPAKKTTPLILRDAKGRATSIVKAHGLWDEDKTDHNASQHAAVLFLSRMHVDHCPAMEALHSVFGMTQAEAELAISLYLGSTLSEASKVLNKSTNTLRTQLRAIFGKTNTRRQLDLLRLIDRLI